VSLKSPLGKVLGLGSAKDGTSRWLAERLSSVAAAVLGLWFVIAILALPSLGFATMHAWVAAPFNAFLVILFLASNAYHAYLGTCVVIEDYVSAHGSRLAALILVGGIVVIAAGGAIFAVLKICFGS
jgi:succinate dehydrogenase / fumarate reductase, membrane anchor subunit